MQKLMKAMHKNEKGFTLVELMVVVVIIGILVAIAIPIYSLITQRAEFSTMTANVRIIDGAIGMAIADGVLETDLAGTAWANLFDADKLGPYVEPIEQVGGETYAINAEVRATVTISAAVEGGLTSGETYTLANLLAE